MNGLAKFATGDIQHDLVAGGEYDFETSDPNYFTNNGLTNTLLNPNENQTFAPTLTYQRVNINTTTNTEGAYFTDTMKLDRPVGIDPGRADRPFLGAFQRAGLFRAAGGHRRGDRDQRQKP